MAYTYERLISDLEHDENWNVIRERANNEKFDLKCIPEDYRVAVEYSIDEYFKRKHENQKLSSNVHYDISHFCKERTVK